MIGFSGSFSDKLLVECLLLSNPSNKQTQTITTTKNVSKPTKTYKNPFNVHPEKRPHKNTTTNATNIQHPTGASGHCGRPNWQGCHLCSEARQSPSTCLQRKRARGEAKGARGREKTTCVFCWEGVRGFQKKGDHKAESCCFFFFFFNGFLVV